MILFLEDLAGTLLCLDRQVRAAGTAHRQLRPET